MPNANMEAVKYAEHIAEKAEIIKKDLKYCSSSDVLHWIYVGLEDIIRAANSLREILKNV